MDTKGTRESKKAVWTKIIEEFNASGENQKEFCKERGINKIQFLYHLTRWKRKNKENSENMQFMPLEMESTNDKWILNISDGVNLIFPTDLSITQISELISTLRKSLC